MSELSIFKSFEEVWVPDSDFDVCPGGYMFPGGRVYSYIPPVCISHTWEGQKVEVVPIAEALRRSTEKQGHSLYIGHYLDKRILNSLVITRWSCGNFYHKAFLFQAIRYIATIPSLAAFWCGEDECFFCFNIERYARQMCIETKSLNWLLIKIWGKVMIKMFGPIFEPDMSAAKDIKAMLKLNFDPNMPHLIANKDSIYSFF